MKLERTKNTGRNIVYGTTLKLYQIVVPFLIRTAMIYCLGIQYVGISSLFVSILQVLNLMELGVGSAMVFSMYKPIAQDDTETICALMRLYRLYYRVIGLAILVIGVILVPFLPHLIKDDLPSDVNLYVLYLLNLAATVASYWLFAYKNCLLAAYQRNDITSKIGMAISTIEYGLELLVIVFFKNYYLYLLVKILTQILSNIVTAKKVDRIFPDYTPRGNMDKEIVSDINRKVQDLFTAKVGGVIVNSADNIVISSFLGLTVLAIYNNYYYILTSVIGFVTIIFNACIAGIGNSLVTETEEKNYNDFKLFTFIIVWISGFCSCCFLCLFQPFMKLWLKDSSSMLGMLEVLCLCIYFFVYEMAAMMIQYKDAAGIWHEDRFRPLITALFNLMLNLILVQSIGLLGVILSTVISFILIGIPWLVKNLFSILFHTSPVSYIKTMVYYILITIMAGGTSYSICTLIPGDGILSFILKGVTCCIIPNIIFTVGYYRLKEFDQAFQLVKRMFGIKN